MLSVGKARISPFPKAMECLRLSPLPEVDVNKRLVERFKDPLSGRQSSILGLVEGLLEFAESGVRS